MITSAIHCAKQPEPNLDTAEKTAVTDLQENDDNIILPADKGHSTVI